MKFESPLPEDVQEQFEHALTDTIANSTDGEASRTVPAKFLDEGLDVPALPGVSAIQIFGFDEPRELQVNIHLSTEADGTPVTDLEDVDTGEDPTSLSDLGDAYEDLADALIKTLTRYLDIPNENREEWFDNDQVGFVCINRSPDGEYALFSARAAYPEFIQEIHAEGRYDKAEQLRIPY